PDLLARVRRAEGAAGLAAVRPRRREGRPAAGRGARGGSAIMAGPAPPTPGGPMTVLLVVLAVLWAATLGYLVVVLRQISAVRRQLEQRAGQEAPSAVTLALVVPQLEQLTARVNET